MDKKKLSIIVGALLVGAALIAMVPIYLDGKINDDLAASLVDFGSKATGTAVTLDESNINIFSGEGTLEGLAVPRSNEGEDGNVLHLGHAAFKVDPVSLWFGPIKITSLKLRRTVLNINIENGKTSLASILRPIVALSKKGSDGSTAGLVVLESFEILTGALRVRVKKENGRTYVRNAVIPLVKAAALGANEGGAAPSALLLPLFLEMDRRVNDVADSEGWFAISLS